MSRKNWEDDEEFMRYVTMRDADGNIVPPIPPGYAIVGVATGEDYDPQLAADIAAQSVKSHDADR
jgi:hypothetical protein